MNILFLGNFEVSYSSESHYKKTFEKLGHAVHSMQEGKVTGLDLLHALHAVPFDMFFWVHTHGWNTEGIQDVLDECRKQRIPSVAYHLDLYLGIQREKNLYRDPYFTVDHFFTVDKLMADFLNNNTPVGPSFARGHFLPAGVLEDECFIGTPDREKYPHDIIFTGSKNYHPEWPYRTRLIDWLQETYGERFGHYGSGGLPNVRGHELNNLYASAKIVVGDTLCKDFIYPYYSSDRLFEVTGRGGFLIYPRIEGLSDFYSIFQVPIYEYGDFVHLKDKIDHYLISDAERNAIRISAFQKAKREHTYTDRLRTLIGTIELYEIKK